MVSALAEGIFAISLSLDTNPVSTGPKTGAAGEMLPALEECLEINWQVLKSPQENKLCYTKEMAFK